jgi:glycosyltransferase involved in cell wall biosynthesis
LVERTGEQPAFRDATLLACGTQDVAEQVVRLGGAPEKILVTPTGVDLDLFDSAPDGGSVRRDLGLDGRFVVGWVGSFRRFHAIENAVDAVARVDGATLLLVGDGPERPAVEALARERRVDAVFTGTAPHAALPSYLAAMDVAVVTASAQRSFHYSPLKLAEYLAAGRCVVAPSIGQIAERLTDGVDAVLYPAGDDRALAAALQRLRDDPSRRADLGRGARASAVRSWSWDTQIERIVGALG